jgi:hypothetical protein
MLATLHEMQIIIDKKNEPVSEFFLWHLIDFSYL